MNDTLPRAKKFVFKYAIPESFIQIRKIGATIDYPEGQVERIRCVLC